MCFLWIFLLRIVSSYLHNFFSIYKRIISKKLFDIPCTTCNKIQTFKHLHIIAMLDVCVVEIKGVEPLTSCLQGRRSSQLSYIPMAYINVLFWRVHWKINNKPSPEDWTQSIFQNFVFLLRKEVIQPHLLIRLPCYDFTPIIDSTFDCCLFTVGSQASGIPNSHGVTGGVYKARERIHGSMLTCHY